MMTSLAKQLQRLAIPHTQAVLGRDTSRHSLLFDPKEAAQLDKETFFAIGVNGLEELENIDTEFQKFEETLFSDSSQTFERSVQTKEVNQKLDADISEILIRLSPYFLLKPSHKVLEWLIYRYHIQFYNVDELMRCVLPYHETKVFVRVVQLLKLDGAATKWDWLFPLQKSGVHLAKSVLINHCKTNPGFLGFLCETVKKYSKVHLQDGSDGGKLRVFFSFYTSTIIGVLEADGATEGTISTLIPYLSRGLKSKLPDHKASSYMILCQLVSKVKVKVAVLETLLSALAKHMLPELLTEALSCMVLVFQTQKIYELPKKCYKYLCRVPHLSVTLGKITAQYHTDKLVQALLTRLIRAAIKQGSQEGASTSESEGETEWLSATPQYSALLESLLRDVPLEGSSANFAARKICECYIDRCAEVSFNPSEVERLDESLKGVIRLLESRYSDALDSSLENLLSEAETKERRNQIKCFVDLTLTSIQKHVVADDCSNLTLALHHRLAKVRSRAVRHLVANIDKLQEEDGQFIEDTILNGLKDDHHDVVKATVQLGQKMWSLVSDKQRLHTSLIGVLQKNEEEGKRLKISLQALGILCSCGGDMMSDIFLSVYPYLLLRNTDGSDVALASVILQSDMAKNHPLLEKISEAWLTEVETWESGQSVDDLNLLTAKKIIKYVMKKKDGEKVVEQLLISTEVGCFRQRSSQALTAIVLDGLLRENNHKLNVPKLAMAQTDLIQDIASSWPDDLSGLNMESDGISTKESIRKVGTCLRHGKHLSVRLCMGWLHNLITYIHLPDSLIKAGYWHLRKEDPSGNTTLRLCISLFDLLLELAARETGPDVGVFRSLLLHFIQTHFSEPRTLMKFLGVLWSSHANDEASAMGLNLHLQVRALHVGLVQLEHLSERKLTSLVQSACPVILPLIIGLSSPTNVVRQMSVSCLQVIQSICDKSSSPYLPVVRKIVRCREEIESDQTFVSQALQVVFGKQGDNAESPSRSRRKSGSKMAAIKLALTDLIQTIVTEDTPLYASKCLLQSLCLHNSEEVVTGLLPLLGRLLSLPVTDMTADHMTILHLLLTRFTPRTAHILTDDSDSLDLFLSALKSPLNHDGFVSVQEVALNQLTNDFYSSIADSDSRQKILSCLIDVLCAPRTPAMANLARKVLKHMTLEGEHIAEELGSVLKSLGAASFKEVKKLRRKAPSQSDDEIPAPVLGNSQWERIAHLLEVIQVKKKIQDPLVLVPVFFKLIARILELEDEGSGEYLKQLLLGCIYNVTTKHIAQMTSGEEEVEFNVELIVQCIRSSDNPQTHHHALLLLTVAARLQPEHLLHNVMSIFTFMGGNILRQDDGYSFHVIGKILETVIPALVTACKMESAKSRKKVKVEDVITMVIRVFVDSYPHIPAHRRLMLFTKLVAIIGEEEYLWRVLLMLTNFMITKVGTKSGEEEEAGETKSSNLIGASDMEFYLRLSTSFDPGQLLIAAKEALVYLSTLPEGKQDKGFIPKTGSSGAKMSGRGKKYDTEIFNVDLHSAKQLRHFKYAAVSLLVSLFESDSFIGQVAADCEEDEMLTQNQELLMTTMEYISQLSKSAEANQTKPTSRFWRALQHKVYDFLDKVVSLLPNETFYEVTSGLMKHDLQHVQRRAMELLNTKLQSQREITSQAEMTVLLSIVGELSDIVEVALLRSNTAEEQAVNGQTALFGLKLLSRHLAHNHPKPFQQVLTLATQVFATRGDNPPVCACGLLCVAELCNSLKVHAIQLLSTFVPKLLQVFHKGEALLGKELLMLSALTALHKLVEKLTHFLSPYLLDIIHQVCHMTSLAEKTPKVQKPQLIFRLTAVKNILATGVPSRVLIPSLVSCYDKMVSDNWEQLPPLMSLLSEHFKHIDKEQLNSQHNQVLDFFYTCLDFRVLHTQVPLETVSDIEASVIDAIITMVMKLSEATFRPMIFKLCDWATRHEDNKDRVLVFYRLADSLAEKLRSLFTLFAGHIIKHTAKMLDENNNSKEGEIFFGEGKSAGEKGDRLLRYLYGYLHKCFLYDNEGFVNKERFQTLMQPLCDQIENTVGGEDLFEQRVTTHLVPCLAQFAVAAQDDASWRSLNYQILLKTRSPTAKVRFAALLVLDELHKQLGEDYMSLLPETIPFLAELMEDDSEEVEKKCQSVIAQMEQTLGEPLQKYF